MFNKKRFSMTMLYIIAGSLAYIYISHYISYNILKKRIVEAQTWGLNICCGKTDGGGVNADIFKHKDVNNFVLVEDIYDLPFHENKFDSVLCSHTIEHVDDPAEFYKELRRVGKDVTVVIPPLYDISAVLNIFEHKWIFLSFKKCHKKLPPHIKLPMASFVQNKYKQINHA